MISKKILFIVFIVSFNSIHAQSTWIQRCSVWGGATYMHNDSVCGLEKAAVGADGFLYLQIKEYTDGDVYLLRTDPNSHAIVWEKSVGYWSTMQWDEPAGIHATSDSGCIIAVNHYNYSGDTRSSVTKYDKNGNIQWDDTLFDINNNFNYWIYDVIENASGNYYALVHAIFQSTLTNLDSLIEFDQAGTVIFSTDAVNGNNLYELSPNDLIVFKKGYYGGIDTLRRTDLAGNVSWTYIEPYDYYNLVAFSPAATFICHTDTGGWATIKKIDTAGGTVLWCDTLYYSSITNIDATADGGVIFSSGRHTDKFAESDTMSGSLVKIDAAGNILWQQTYSFPYFGLSTVKELPSGNYITGGTWHVKNWWNPPRDYASFAAVLDSSGNGVLQTTSYMWPGDANHNDTIYFPEDILYMALGLGGTGLKRDTLGMASLVPFEFSNYAVDWQQSFANGVNYKHADYNGDGTIDTSDVYSFLMSSGLFLFPNPVVYRNTYFNTIAGITDFILLPEKDSVAPGDVMRFNVIAGNAAQPTDSVYGIAFSAFYDYLLTDMSVPNVAVSNSDFGILGTNLLGACSAQPAANDIRMVFSKTDNLNAYQLYDTLGVIEFISDPGITSPQTFVLQFSSFYSLTHSTSSVAFNTINGTVIIDPALVSLEENNPGSEINIFPNPVKDKIKIQSSGLQIEKIEIVNLYGKIIHAEAFAGRKNAELYTGNLADGIYSLKVYSDKKISNLKFIKFN